MQCRLKARTADQNGENQHGTLVTQVRNLTVVKKEITIKSTAKTPPGGVAERLNAPVLKTGVSLSKKACQSQSGQRLSDPAKAPAVNSLASCLASLLQEQPELALLVEAWPSLPKAVRAGILAMVRASCGE